MIVLFFLQDDDESSSCNESFASQSPTMGSPSRFGSCRDLSPPTKTSATRLPLRSRTPSPTKFSSVLKCDVKSGEKNESKPADDEEYDSGKQCLLNVICPKLP